MTVATFWSGASSAQAEEYVGRASVVDGDTLDIVGKRIRLWGIDAPESSQLCMRDEKTWQCGRDAALALADWLGARTVRCVARTTDRYGRSVSLCRVDGEDISAWLVSNGWALAFRRYSSDYVSAEEQASVGRRGIWGAKFQAPWDWRAEHRR